MAESCEPTRADRWPVALVVFEVLPSGLDVRGHPRVERGDPEEVQVRPEPEVRAPSSGQKVRLVVAVCRLNGPSVVVVLSERTGLSFVHVQIRHEGEPAHPVVRLEDVASIPPFNVRLQCLLALSVGDPLGFGIEELRELLLCVVARVANLARILAEQRHLGAFGRGLILIDKVSGLDAGGLVLVFPLFGVAADVVLWVGDHEVHASPLEHVRHLSGREIGVGKEYPDVASVGFDGVQQVGQLLVHRATLDLEVVAELNRHPVAHGLSRENLVGVVRVLQLLRPDHAGQVRGFLSPRRDVRRVHRDREVTASKTLGKHGIEDPLGPPVEDVFPLVNVHPVDVVAKGLGGLEDVHALLEAAVVRPILQFGLGRVSGIAKVQTEIEVLAIVRPGGNRLVLRDRHIVSEQVERPLRVATLALDRYLGDAAVVREALVLHLRDGEVVGHGELRQQVRPLPDEFGRVSVEPFLLRSSDRVLVRNRIESEHTGDRDAMSLGPPEMAAKLRRVFDGKNLPVDLQCYHPVEIERIVAVVLVVEHSHLVVEFAYERGHMENRIGNVGLTQFLRIRYSHRKVQKRVFWYRIYALLWVVQPVVKRLYIGVLRGCRLLG